MGSSVQAPGQARRNGQSAHGKIFRKPFSAIQSVTRRPSRTDNCNLRQFGYPFLAPQVQHNRRIENLAQQWRIEGIKNINDRDAKLLGLFSFQVCLGFAPLCFGRPSTGVGLSVHLRLLQPTLARQLIVAGELARSLLRLTGDRAH